MLEKNDYPVDIKKERKSIIGKVGRKKVVTFKLVNSLSKVNKETGRRQYKRRHAFETAYVTNDKDGNSEEYRYYKTKNQRGKNGTNDIRYTPEFVMFEDGLLHVNLGDSQNENLDLFQFLMNHPRRANNNKGEGVKRPLFYLIDENQEALEYALKKQASSEMDNLLWNPSNRLSDEDLYTIAKALRIPNVEDMNIQRVQTSIEKACKGNPQRFLNMRTIDDETAMRAVIQGAVENNILLFDSVRSSWTFIDGESKVQLCTVRKTDDERTTLVHHLKQNDDLDYFSRIKELVHESKKPQVKKAFAKK
jgi:hypothetical protein